ncbi:hypothetical protein MTO96_028422 [Rhipicephalus appendiculatus]
MRALWFTSEGFSSESSSGNSSRGARRVDFSGTNGVDPTLSFIGGQDGSSLSPQSTTARRVLNNMRHVAGVQRLPSLPGPVVVPASRSNVRAPSRGG